MNTKINSVQHSRPSNSIQRIERFIWMNKFERMRWSLSKHHSLRMEFNQCNTCVFKWHFFEQVFFFSFFLFLSVLFLSVVQQAVKVQKNYVCTNSKTYSLAKMAQSTTCISLHRLLYNVLSAFVSNKLYIRKCITYLLADSWSKSSMAWRSTVTNKTWNKST